MSEPMKKVETARKRYNAAWSEYHKAARDDIDRAWRKLHRSLEAFDKAVSRIPVQRAGVGR